MRIAGCITLALFTGACCCGPLDSGSRDEIPAGQEVAITPLAGYSADHSDFQSRERVVAENDSAWRPVAARLFDAGATILAIDFSREIVVVAAMGSLPTGGYSIQVKRAVRTETELVLEVVETSPSRGCVVTQAITRPVHAVRMERTGLAVRFVNRDVIDCD